MLKIVFPKYNKIPMGFIEENYPYITLIELDCTNDVHNLHNYNISTLHAVLVCLWFVSFA